MKRPPLRIKDDPDMPSQLREDLKCAAAVSPVVYDLQTGLNRLQNSTSSSSVSQGSGSEQILSTIRQPGTVSPATGLWGWGIKAWIVSGILVVGIVGMMVAYITYTDPSGSGTPPEQIAPVVTPRMKSGSDIPHYQEKEQITNDTAVKEQRAADDLTEPGNMVQHSQQAVVGSDSPSVREKKRRKRVVEGSPSQPSRTNPIKEPPVTSEIDPDLRLRQEIAHLAKTRHLLQTNPAAALHYAQQGQQEYKTGMFVEERQAIIVLALDKLNRDEQARKYARSFLHKYPEGPFSERIREILEKGRVHE